MIAFYIYSSAYCMTCFVCTSKGSGWSSQLYPKATCTVLNAARSVIHLVGCHVAGPVSQVCWQRRLGLWGDIRCRHPEEAQEGDPHEGQTGWPCFSTECFYQLQSGQYSASNTRYQMKRGRGEAWKSCSVAISALCCQHRLQKKQLLWTRENMFPAIQYFVIVLVFNIPRFGAHCASLTQKSSCSGKTVAMLPNELLWGLSFSFFVSWCVCMHASVAVLNVHARM